MLKKMNCVWHSSKLVIVITLFSMKLTFNTVHISEIKKIPSFLKYLTYTIKVSLIFLSLSSRILDIDMAQLTHPRPYHCLTDRLLFFYQVFDPVHQWLYHGLTGLVFSIFFFSNPFSSLNVSDHTTVSQTGLKKKSSVRPWYGHWCLGVKCLRKRKKNNLSDCDIVIRIC